MCPINDFYVVTLYSRLDTDPQGEYVTARNEKDIERKHSFRAAERNAYAHCELPHSIAAGVWYGDRLLKYYWRRGVYIASDSRKNVSGHQERN